MLLEMALAEFGNQDLIAKWFPNLLFQNNIPYLSGKQHTPYLECYSHTGSVQYGFLCGIQINKKYLIMQALYSA